MTTSKTKKSKRPEVDRPQFAKAYPRDDELDRLVTAFERGNFKLVRDEAEDLAERTDDEGVRAAALDLRRRLNPDPIAIYLLAIGVSLVLFLYGYYLLHAH